MAPDATIDLRSTPTPTTPAPPPAPALSDLYGDTGGLVAAPPTAAHQGVAHGASGSWDETLAEKVKSRIAEPVKQSEIEKIPGLQPDVVTQLSEKGQDTLGSLFGKERADYLREHILHGFTPEVTARAAAKTLTDWYSPEMQAISAPGRVAHGYAAAAELADKAGEVEKASELANKARLTGILGTASGVPLVGKQATDLAENWKTMSPTERAAAISGIVGGTVMTGVGAVSAKTATPKAAAEPEGAPAEDLLTFDKVGGKELPQSAALRDGKERRASDSMGRSNKTAFGRTVNTTYDVIRKSESEQAQGAEVKAEGPEWDRTHSAVIDGKKVGLVGYKLDPDGRAQIYGSQVSPELRGKGIGQKLYRSAIDDAQSAGAEKITSDSTNTSPEANRVWEKLKEKGLPVENITHPNGKPGYQIDFTKPAEAPEPQFHQTLARRGEMPGQTVNLSPAYGETGSYVGGHEPLLTNERQTALKEPWSIEIQNQDGTKRVEKVDAFSSKDALKTAQKKFPDASEWSSVTPGERTPSTEYSVPTKKLLSMPENMGDTPVKAMRHELGHALIGQNEGFTPTGMLRHTHPDLARQNARLSVAWKADDVFEPGTQKVKSEKLPGLVKMFMGGIAADEHLNDVPRSANPNFNRNLHGSDANKAYGFLKAYGLSHEESMEYMHKSIDAAKEHLTKPSVSAIIKENENVREPNLSKQYHYSAERLQQIHAESQRRLSNGEGQPDNGTANGRGNSIGEENVARGKGEGARGTAGGPKEVGPEEIAPAFAKAPTYHPDLQKVVDRYGISEDASGMKGAGSTGQASFILPDGKFTHLPAGVEHPDATRRAGVPASEDSRIEFLNDTGAIRTRFSKDRAGDTMHISVPKGGVSAEQIPAIRQAIAQAGRNGNVVMERADVAADTKNQLTMSKEFPSPADAEDYLRQIQAHPDQHGKDIIASSKKAAKPVETEPWHDEAAKSMAANGAFTINPRTGVMPESGHLLEAVPEVRQVSDKPSTAEEIKKFADTPAVAKLLKKYPELQVGGYKNDAGKYELNLSAASQDPAAAKDVATKLDQESTWDAGAQKLNPAGGKNQKTSFPDYSVEQRLRDLAPKEPGSTISTRFPTAVAATEDAMRHNLTLGAEHLTRNPVLTEKWANAVKDIPGFKAPEGADAKGTINAFVGHVKDNLKWLYDQSSPEEQKANQGWYEGAHQITKDLAAEHGYTHSQTAGVMASLSPQKDWAMNVSLAKRLTDIVKNKQNEKATPDMIAKGKSIIAGSRKVDPKANSALESMLDKLKGKKLSQLIDPIQKAAWVRLYDETNNSREFEVIGPDGKPKGMRKNADGSPGQVGWGSFNEINKAMDILADGSRENISKTLGSGAHKVRSFYNNIIEPDSPKGDVTVDTHAVAAGLLRPLSGKSKEVIQNFSGPSSSVEGLNGTYPLFHAAYTQAAKELDISHPRQLQSVVWEKIRNLFPSEFKTPENNEAIDAIWKEHENGKITADQAREQVLDYAKSHAGISEGERAGNQQGELPSGGVSGESARTGRRAGSGIAMGSSPEGVGDTSFDFGANVKSAAPTVNQIVKQFDQKYPKAASTVDGRTVRADVPNMGSIDASLPNYEVLSGVREIPMSDFPQPPSVTAKSKQLADDIKTSGEINPLIIAVDKNGPYILEGANRYDALKMSGAKSFPAVVAIDTHPSTIPEPAPKLASKSRGKKQFTALDLMKGLKGLKAPGGK